MSKHPALVEIDKQCALKLNVQNKDQVLKSLKEIKQLASEKKEKKDYKASYIHCKKWINAVNWLRGLPIFKSDKTYSDLMIPPKEVSAMSELLNELEQILISKASSHITNSMEKIQIREKPDAAVPHFPAKSAFSLPDIPTEDSKPNELQQISCIELFNSSKKPTSRLLVVDVRPEIAFEHSRIKNYKCINIPPQVIKNGKHIKKIALYLENRDQTMYDYFKLRGKEHTDTIVFVDTNSNQENAKELYDTFRNWDLELKYGKMAVLKDGFEHWCHTYPAYTTNSNLKLPDVQKSNNESLQNINYSDLMKFEDEDNERSTKKSILKFKSSTDNVTNHVNKSQGEFGHSSKGSTEIHSRVTLIPFVDRSSKPSLKTLENEKIFLNLMKNRLKVMKEILNIERDIKDYHKIFQHNGFNEEFKSSTIKHTIDNYRSNLEKKVQENTKLKNELEELKNNLVLSSQGQAQSEKLSLDIGIAEQQHKSFLLEKEKTKAIQEKPKTEEIYKEPLKSENFSTDSGLRRSLSSPNLAQITDRKLPIIDRTLKPSTDKNVDSYSREHRLSISGAGREERLEPVYRNENETALNSKRVTFINGHFSQNILLPMKSESQST